MRRLGFAFAFGLAGWCVAVAGGCARLEADRSRATKFLDKRRITLPTNATDVAFAENDQLRAIAYFIRLDLPESAGASFQSQLWCEPAASPETTSTLSQRSPSWFTAAELADVKRCDTNGPYAGQYHLDATVGRTPSGQTRFLLSFSD